MATLPAVAALLASAFLSAAARAQTPDPPWQSICDMPESTPHWHQYCGGGNGSSACDDECRQQRRDEEERNRKEAEDAKELKRLEREARENRKREADKIQKANDLAKKAQRYFDEKNWDKAQQYYAEALGLVDWPQWTFARALALRKLHRTDQALAEYQRIIDAGLGSTDPSVIGRVSAAEILVSDTLKGEGRRCANRDCATGAVPDPYVEGKTYKMYSQGTFKLSTSDGHVFTENNFGTAYGISLQHAHLTTGPGSKVTFLLPAGDIATFGPNSDTTIEGDDSFFAEKGDSLSHVIFVLNDGKFRWTSGDEHKKKYDKTICRKILDQSFFHSLPVDSECNVIIYGMIAVGIRGTEYEVDFNSDRTQATIRQYSGQTVINDGGAQRSLVLDAGSVVNLGSKGSLDGPVPFDPATNP